MDGKLAAAIAAIVLACAGALTVRSALADGSACADVPGGSQSEAAQARVKVSNPGEMRSIWVTYSWDPCPHDWHFVADIYPPGTHWVSMINWKMRSRTDTGYRESWYLEGNANQGATGIVDTYYHKYYVGFVGTTSVPAGYQKNKEVPKVNTFDVYVGPNRDRHYHGHFHYEHCDWIIDEWHLVSKDDEKRMNAEGVLDEYDNGSHSGL